jgi:hypothetical protein
MELPRQENRPDNGFSFARHMTTAAYAAAVI